MSRPPSDQTPRTPVDVYHDGSPSAPRWDLFISHASEDKAAVVEPLVTALKAQGLRVWYDRAELTLGDSLRKKIDEGLAECTFGVVIISPAFLAKRWPQAELDALFAREESGEKSILPVWHEVDSAGLAERSPLLASRLAVRWADGVDRVVSMILCALSARSRTTTRSGTAASGSPRVQSMYDWMVPVMEQLDQTIKNGPSLPTGLRQLDRALIDLARHRLVVVGGRPEAGKTALVLAIAVGAGRAGKGVGLVTLRDSASELVMWMVAMMARLDLWRLRNGLLSDTEYERLAGALGPAGDLPFVIAESPNLELTRVVETAREMHATSGIHLLILDGFDGIYRSDGGSVSRDLYLLARELAVPIVVTAEIKPTVERRPDRRPLVVDMPDPSLADEADCVLMLYRDEHYLGSRSEKPGIVEVAVVKNRLGPRDVVDLAWDERGFIHELAVPSSIA